LEAAGAIGAGGTYAVFVLTDALIGALAAEAEGSFKGAEVFAGSAEGGLQNAGEDSLGFGKNESVVGRSLCFERLDVSCCRLIV
jgi:hypothetical protein